MVVKKHSISVCIIAKPYENIDKCLNSIKNQIYSPKEIVVHRGIGRFSVLRNNALDKASGEIIVFIDSDCYSEKHWLEEINYIFLDKSIIGFFGKVCYELNGNFPTAKTRVISNDGNDTMTANAGFRSDILKRVRFDEDFNYLEDKILFKRMKKEGKIIYSNEAIVFHEYQEWTFKKAINYAKKVEDFLKADKKYGMPINRLGPLIYPQHILIIFFPPILFLYHSIRGLKDLNILTAMYMEKIYTRLLIWRYAIKNREFLF
ncbi:MAG: glycosyltransferase family A protein [Nanoarchaeota archaeon]